MESIWMGISPSPVATRVVAMSGPSETILKAHLATEPKHPRALVLPRTLVDGQRRVLADGHRVMRGVTHDAMELGDFVRRRS